MSEHIGGQAVIEGVMMMSPSKLAVSVRLPNGKIRTKKERFDKAGKIAKVPFVRGVFMMLNTLVKGMRALIWSADQQLGKEEKVTKKEITLSLLGALVFAVVLFIGVPFIVTRIFFEKGLLFNIVDGLIRIAMFVIYVLVISLMKDVLVLFQYHGAEHKAVNCYEAGKKVTIENAKKFSTVHKRCGTSFLMIVLIVSIIVFSLILSSHWYYNLLARIILIPVIAGISYEILKSGEKSRIVAFLSSPGLWLQRITTKEPTNKQLEVAITALKEALR